MTGRPSVLFVCARNSGKSQLAAALMADLAGDAVEVASAGTAPGDALNEQSVRSLAELGIDISGERPKPVSERLVRDADVVVTLGREARVEPVPGTRLLTWDVDEPSARGVEGMDRMRLVRDDIARQVRSLAAELGVDPRPR
ncbi:MULTISPECIES: arsenate-mycothiol transferase ArsC [unclassified Modestobacter]|uniref:arsenate-mycothiol transferase ArsC n=1 Tax=unclassified Modestobacter TaxID=2643866 RepID=UPI0022AA412C|nr:MULTISPECIES: low molecular weight phosphatase family protein [unclassified Modestobacter]MCZ2812793.1 low molecular weight phosphatase family protein [Modestobacter sp. VKM Ac-2979]MCZ2843178.1 low molecular weight phosphatase family protein [Modestobacter sp. VKM Ac-2980]MCZ2847785.1 low molecular weight phosphatase family protein [Modestobacter sp. VKM Ac-2978]